MRAQLFAFGILLLVVGPAIVTSACILDAEGFSSGAPPVADEAGSSSSGTSGNATSSSSGGGTSSSGDVPPLVEGGADTGSGGPNVLQNADFEVGCATWAVDFGTIAESTVSRNGTRACRFCRGGNFEAFFYQTVKTAVPAGSEWFGEVWLRTEADAGPGPDQSNLIIEVRYPDDNEFRGTTSVGPPLTSSWQRIPAIASPPLAGSEVNLILRIQNGTNCVLVDDAVLRRTK